MVNLTINHLIMLGLKHIIPQPLFDLILNKKNSDLILNHHLIKKI